MAYSVALESLRRRLQSRSLRTQRVFLKPYQDAFEFPEDKFMQTFRLPKEAVRMICDELKVDLEPLSSQKTAFTTERKVLCALRFFATGSYQGSVSSDYSLMMLRPAVSTSISQVCLAIEKRMLMKWIKFPTDSRALLNQKAEFYMLAQVPGVVGAIDCTHVEIVGPGNSDAEYPEHIYVNRHCKYSINVQMVCDTNLRILNCNAKFPGSSHDSFIWRNCALRRKMRELSGRDSYCWLLGDSGYPLEPWLMTPVKDPDTPEEETYNKKHAKTRNPIERCFGVLKSRFRCLLGERILHYHPLKAARIVNACAVLHNVCIHYKVPEPKIKIVNSRNDDDEDDDDDVNLDAQQVRRMLIAAVNSRT